MKSNKVVAKRFWQKGLVAKIRDHLNWIKDEFKMEYMVIDNGTSILAMSTKDGARWRARDGHKWDESTKAAYSCAQRFKSKLQVEVHHNQERH